MKRDTRQITEDIKEHLKDEELDKALSLIADLHPADQADVFENLELAQRQELIEQLPATDSADIMEELEDEHAAQLAIQMEPAALSLILDEMEADEAADVLGDLPAETVAVALEAMTEAEDVIPLLRYPDDTAGGLMIPDFIALRPEMTTAEAIEHIRRVVLDDDMIYYLFVTDENGVLLGVVGLRQLIVADSQRRIGQIMDEAVIYVEAWTDQEECARLLSRYDFLAVPVVDE
jgi:magnesium transporter